MNHIKRIYMDLIFVLLSIITFYFLYTSYNYLLFHSVIELVTILVGFGVFIIAWNSKKFNEEQFLIFIGISFLFPSSLDLIHTLAYKGMNIFVGFDANLPTQLWIAARYLQSLSMLFAFVLLRKKIKPILLILIYFIITVGALVAIFTGRFPDCYVEGVGLTNFKIASEYLVSLIFVISGIIFAANRKSMDRNVYTWILTAIALFIVGELVFTQYIGVYDFANFVGHLFKFFSYYFIYKAIIETGISKPNALLHKELNNKLEDLRLMSYELIHLQEEERKRLALDLHDHLGQSLTILKLTCRSSIVEKSNLADLKEKLNMSSKLLNEVIESILDLSLKLRPPMLDDLGLVPTIEWYITRVKEHIDIEISPIIDIESQKRLTPDLEITIFRILEEAINNILKHSKAEKVEIHLSENDGNIIFEIEDDGVGFRNGSGEVSQASMGIYSMRERVTNLGGEFTIKSDLDRGTKVKAVLPNQ